MTSNRHAQTPGDSFQGDSGNDESPNPLYLATSHSEHSTLNRHNKPTTLAEISMSRGHTGNADGSRPHSDREKRHRGQQSPYRNQHYQQSHHLNQPQPHSSSRYAGSDVDSNTSLERPDSQTWDRHATGRTAIGSPGHSASYAAAVTGGTNQREESPRKVSNSSEEKKTQQTSTTMQARSLRLSLGASTDLAKEPRKIPAVNCPEKIILCLDVSKETENLSFRMRNGDKMSFIALIKRALGIYLRTKHMMNPNHEFSVMYLGKSSVWAFDFCNDPVKVLTILEGMAELADCDSCELSSIFDEVQKHFAVPPSSDVMPPYTVRVILIYGRSICIPQLTRKPHHKALETSNCFCVDVLYVHEPPSPENNCEKIFDILCDMDERGTSYILEVSKNPTKVFDCMAQLLAHPLQRCLQQDVNYCSE